MEYTEFDEQSEDKVQALYVLYYQAREYFAGRESHGVMSAHERAAINAGASPGEADATIRKAKEDQRARFLKRAWIRNPDVPAGQSAPGRLNCPCGQTPESEFKPGPDIMCPCGTVYTWDGWIVEERSTRNENHIRQDP